MLINQKLYICIQQVQRCISKKKCFVYISKNSNPYQNLAFEHWMYEKVDFRNLNCLLIWRNLPSVIIGRHQNPWKECNLSEALKHGINVCRRNSGGGTVYHDLGNINFTFFTERKNYNRKSNLDNIVSGLKNFWPSLDVEINCRDDIILNGIYKISGSSAKLGQRNCYHHCTLLVDSKKENILKFLASPNYKISCNATSSVRSSIMNLNDVDNRINFHQICEGVVESYSKSHSSCTVFDINTNDECLTPGVNAYCQSFKDWNWIFGKTPDFTIKINFEENKFDLKTLGICVKKGFICSFKLNFLSELNVDFVQFINNNLSNTQFNQEVILEKLRDCKKKYVNFEFYPFIDFLCVELQHVL